MRYNILLLIISILIGAGLTFWLDAKPAVSSSENISDKAETASYEKFPHFTFTDIKGNKHNTKDFKGKIIVLNFWATWCAPCVVEFPKLVKLAQNHPDVIVIALSSDTSNEAIQKFLKKNPAKEDNFIIARDQKRKITTDIFQTYKIPETLIISPSGYIVKKIIGDTEWNGSEIKKLLLSLEK